LTAEEMRTWTVRPPSGLAIWDGSLKGR